MNQEYALQRRQCESDRKKTFIRGREAAAYDALLDAIGQLIYFAKHHPEIYRLNSTQQLRRKLEAAFDTKLPRLNNQPE